MTELQRYFKGNADYYIEMGKHFGYPECCINQFIETYGAMEASEERKIASSFTGFIPCDIHAKEILDGKTTLSNLITNRQEKTPFPND
jgi:hypothetical protein